MNKRYGIIVAARTDSSRVPRKITKLINGRLLLEHLLIRLKKVGVPLYLAIPEEQRSEFDGFAHLVDGIFPGSKDDVLYRLYRCAIANGLDAIVRVTADKLFISHTTLQDAILQYDKSGSDYYIPSGFTDGTRFEIIDIETLGAASSKYRGVELVSYAVRAIAKRPIIFTAPNDEISSGRFLVDYPEDIVALDTILSSIGNDCSVADAIRFVERNQWIKKINAMPGATIYTCAKNVEKWIDRTMGSVSEQKDFRCAEYILIDDCSDDQTPVKMARFSTLYKNVRFIRNPRTLGLAASSNIALDAARARWIIRMDGDDYFTSKTAVSDLVEFAERTRLDAIYPANYFGSIKVTQPGQDRHHVGGALFNASAIHAFRFTSGIQGFEGLDLFARAKDALRIGYFPSPTFFYRQRHDSMSKTNIVVREKIKQQIEGISL